MNNELTGKYKLVLGLEIHLHLRTGRKMFCRCKTDVYGAKPNTRTCPTCLGLPGALPVPNGQAIRMTQLLGLALNSKINQASRFDRKHYFYPDLPKGYQISQYKQPFCQGGHLVLKSGKKAELERIHLEEDTAKSMHEQGKTLIDFNLSSMPLVEIVTKPIFDNVDEAVEFCHRVQEIVRNLKLGDVDMEKGQMRLEPNISLRTPEMEKKGKLPNYKVEIKNINSFKFMENAVKAEVARQRQLLEEGETPIQENRGYIESTKETVSQRSKEQAHDYRYFPEPDIPPFVFDDKYLDELKREYEILIAGSSDNIKQKMLVSLKVDGELSKKATRLLDETDLKKISELFGKGFEAEELINLFLNRKEFRQMTVNEIEKKLSENRHRITDDTVLKNIVLKVLSENKSAVESYKKGKESALQFLLGSIMRETKGKADIEKAKELVLKEIKLP